MAPLYLRPEPTEDRVIKTFAGRIVRLDVVAYEKPDAPPVARWPWYQSPPRRGCASVTLDCTSRPAVWLPAALA